MIPLRLTLLSVATPPTSVAGQVTEVDGPQTAMPSSVKLMVSLGTGLPPEVNVAVSVAVPPYVPLPETAETTVGCVLTLTVRLVVPELVRWIADVA